jgi:beta-glucanase (GH16 family)
LRVQGRLALPSVTGTAAQGYLSAFWLLGSTFRPSHVYDPTLGELDIVEHINGRDPLGVLHCLPATGTGDPCHEKPDNVGLVGTATCSPSGCLSGFHTFAVELHRECEPERIDWLVDGRVFFSVRQDQPGMDGATWERIVGQSFFVILNQSIGGTWPGAPTPQTQPGSPLVVDSIAVSVLEPRRARSPKRG